MNLSSAFLIRFLPCLLLVTLTGCDAIKSIGQDGEEAEEVAADSDPSVPPEAGTPAGEEEQNDNAPPVEQQTPPEQTPEDFLAAFLEKPSVERSDTDLEQLANAPNLLGGITELDLRAGRITNVGLRYLPSFPDLERVDISETLVNNDGLSQLLPCEKLTAIALDRLPLVDEIGVREIAALPLQEISLRNTSVTEGIFQILAEFDDLHTLYIDGNANLNGQQLRGLIAEFEKLKVLSASGSRIGFGLQTIGQLSNLEIARISDADVGDEAVEQLAQCRKLVELDLSGNPLTFISGPFLARMDELQILILRNCGSITDDILGDLGRMDQLTRLDLTGTSCTLEGVQNLKERLEDTVIVFDDQEL